MNYRDFIATRQASADLREFEDGPYGWRQNGAETITDPIPGFAYCGGSYAIEALDENAFRVIIQFENDYADLATAEFVLFYWYGRHVGQSAELNLFERLEMACRSSDLDFSCRIIQDALGQDDGGPASIFFSYATGTDGPNDENWRTADTGTRWGWMADYIRHELSIVDGRLQGDGALFEPSTVLGRLKARGWTEYHTGGGCMALINSNFGGDVYALATNDDLNVPDDNACRFGVYDGDECKGTFQGDGGSFEAAYTAAMDLAARLDMEQSAKRRGDL